VNFSVTGADYPAKLTDADIFYKDLVEDLTSEFEEEPIPTEPVNFQTISAEYSEADYLLSISGFLPFIKPHKFATMRHSVLFERVEYVAPPPQA